MCVYEILHGLLPSFDLIFNFHIIVFFIYMHVSIWGFFLERFALERHCLSNQVIYPKDKILGKFKSDFIYPRSHVQEVSFFF